MAGLVECVDSVYVPVRDKQAAIRWYEEKLELSWTGHCFALESGPTIFLVAAKYDDAARIGYSTDDWEGLDYEMHLLTFFSNDIEKTYRTLKERGVRVSPLQTYDGNRTNFRFLDEDGNKFDVWSGWR